MKELRTVFATGESVLDILFKDFEPVASCPGGSALNTCISLSRLGSDVAFISEFGHDKAGDLILNFLRKNKVITSYIRRFPDGNTTISLAFLDRVNKNANYTFYRNYPDIRMDILLPEFTRNDILLFGSFFSIDPKLSGFIDKLTDEARNAGSIIFYDPNFRRPHLDMLNEVKGSIMLNFSKSHIVRGSDEDFNLILGTHSGKETWNRLRSLNSMTLVYTSGPDSVELFTPHFQATYSVPIIEPLSTVGAGDTFNAGIIYGLQKHGIFASGLEQVKREIWDNIIKTSIRFSTAVCLSYDNFLPLKITNTIRSAEKKE